MNIHIGLGQRDFRNSPIPVTQRHHWELFCVHHGHFGMVFSDKTVIYNKNPTVWVLGPELHHGKIGDGSICNVANISIQNIHPLLAQVCKKNHYLQIELSPTKMMAYLDHCRRIQELDHAQDPLHSIKEEIHFQQMYLLLLEQLPKHQLPLIENHDRRRVNSAFLWYQEHMEKGLSLPDISASVHLSESHFRKLVRINLNKSAQVVMQELQMEKAKGLLAMDFSIEQIASACGFGSLAAFSRAFKRQVGSSPFHWKKEHCA